MFSIVDNLCPRHCSLVKKVLLWLLKGWGLHHGFKFYFLLRKGMEAGNSKLHFSIAYLAFGYVKGSSGHKPWLISELLFKAKVVWHGGVEWFQRRLAGWYMLEGALDMSRGHLDALRGLYTFLLFFFWKWRNIVVNTQMFESIYISLCFKCSM